MTIEGMRRGNWEFMSHRSLFFLLVSLAIFGCSETNGRAARIDISLAQPIPIDAAMLRFEELVSHFDCEPWGSPKLQAALGAAQWDCNPVHPEKSGGFSIRFGPFKRSAS